MQNLIEKVNMVIMQYIGTGKELVKKGGNSTLLIWSIVGILGKAGFRD